MKTFIWAQDFPIWRLRCLPCLLRTRPVFWELQLGWFWDLQPVFLNKSAVWPGNGNFQFMIIFHLSSTATGMGSHDSWGVVLGASWRVFQRGCGVADSRGFVREGSCWSQRSKQIFARFLSGSMHESGKQRVATQWPRRATIIAKVCSPVRNGANTEFNFALVLLKKDSTTEALLPFPCMHCFSDGQLNTALCSSPFDLDNFCLANCVFVTSLPK